jgi:hypothetical protein
MLIRQAHRFPPGAWCGLRIDGNIEPRQFLQDNCPLVRRDGPPPFSGQQRVTHLDMPEAGDSRALLDNLGEDLGRVVSIGFLERYCENDRGVEDQTWHFLLSSALLAE